jgi:hypothetical protein
MATVNALLGATLNIATSEGADPYYADPEGGGSLTRLPPVYSFDDFSVTVNFEAVPEDQENNWTVTNVVATPESTFNYSTTSSSVTITEQTSPFGSTWYCLMEDYSYQTFDTDDEVLTATNPAYKALVSLDLVEPYQIDKTHQFTVTIVEDITGTTQTVAISLPETIYLNVPSFIARVQSLVQAGS